MPTFSCENSVNAASVDYVDCVAITVSGALQDQIDACCNSDFENNKSLYLDGLSEWVQRSAVSSNDFGAGMDLTLNGWVKILNSSGDYNSIVDYQPGASAGQRIRFFMMEADNASDPSDMYCDTGGGTSHNTTDNIWNWGEWFMFSLHINNSHFQFYKNGVVQTNEFEDTGSDLDSSLTGDLKFGGVENLMGGFMRHFSVHSGNLNATQLLAMYNGGTAIDLREDQGNYTASSSLRHYWFLGDNDDLGPEGIRDRVGSLHMTVSGTPLIVFDTPHRS